MPKPPLQDTNGQLSGNVRGSMLAPATSVLQSNLETSKRVPKATYKIRRLAISQCGDQGTDGLNDAARRSHQQNIVVGGELSWPYFHPTPTLDSARAMLRLKSYNHTRLPC